jgi:pimeloyl-ACP methyl ester carboxylesterase
MHVDRRAGRRTISREEQSVKAAALAALLVAATVVVGCSPSSSDQQTSAAPTPGPASSSEATHNIEAGDLVTLSDGRKLYVRCSGAGLPTVVLEGGDLDTTGSYAFAERDLTAVTRTCVYDRANLGSSDPAPGPRQLSDLVADLEGWIDASGETGPFVLVGTSGGGYITAGYAVEHPEQVAGMVFVDVGAPFLDPPSEIIDETRPDNPENIEKRDYLQVEKDAWAARRLIGDIPVTVISNQYSEDEIAGAEFPSERRGMETNVEEQRGWLVLSPRAEQLVVTTGHAVEEADPQLVIEAILDVVSAVRAER